jgi:hypothetical protein
MPDLTSVGSVHEAVPTRNSVPVILKILHAAEPVVEGGQIGLLSPNSPL